MRKVRPVMECSVEGCAEPFDMDEEGSLTHAPNDLRHYPVYRYEDVDETPGCSDWPWCGDSSHAPKVGEAP